jgi:hypothetical protein
MSDFWSLLAILASSLFAVLLGVLIIVQLEIAYHLRKIRRIERGLAQMMHGSVELDRKVAELELQYHRAFAKAEDPELRESDEYLTLLAELKQARQRQRRARDLLGVMAWRREDRSAKIASLRKSLWWVEYVGNVSVTKGGQ